MGQEAIDRAAREARRRRVLGAGTGCPRCSWEELPALTKDANGVLCYECRCAEPGRATVEQHHHAGRANDPATVPVPGNLHRELSERQHDWPAEVRRNPERDPLLWLAAACYGLRDHLAWWAAWLARVADWLVALARELRDRSGPAWWMELGVGAPWQGAAP